MRTKRRGGRARLSKLRSPAPTTITRSAHFLNLNLEEANGGYGIGRIVPDDDNVASACIYNETDCTKMPGGLGSSGEYMDIDLLEGETCITCNRGGENVLACGETGCPIALHESCMNYGPKFDVAGNFYCPYCWYKREVARTEELRKKAMEAKKALSRFMDLKTIVHDEVKNGGTDKGKELNMSPLARDRNCGHGESRMDNDQVDGPFVEVEEDQENDGEHAQLADTYDQCKTAVERQSDSLAPSFHSGENMNHSQEKAPAVNSISEKRPTEGNASKTHELKILGDGENIQVEDSGQVDDSGSKRIAEDQIQAESSRAFHVEEENVVDDSGHPSKAVKLNLERREEEEEMHPKASGAETSISDEETILEHQWRAKQRIKKKAPHSVNSPKKLSSPLNVTPKKSARAQNQKVTASKKSRQQEVASEKFANLVFANEKRRRLNWSAEEEEILKEGVQKFSSEVHKNLPWRKILEFGRHVFDPTRNPVDLKDKWRNMMTKESSTINRS